VAQLSDERRRLERELADTKKSLALGGAARTPTQSTASSAETKLVGGVPVDIRIVEGVAAKDLKSLADDAKARIKSGVVAFVAVADGKASLVVGVTDDLTSRISAVDLVRAGSEALGGKGGGGRPDMAQAGGPEVDHAERALAAVEQALRARAGEGEVARN
jgi:alanyl-tRNA synthetase